MTGRNLEALDALAGQTGATVVHADLAVGDDVERLVEAVADVDILVSNAALPAAGPVDGFTVEEVDRALAVNLRAPILLARAASQAMATRGNGGHIVFISSMGGAKMISPGLSLYGATKAGLRAFGLALREDLRAQAIGVSVVFPGPISEAGMWADSALPPPPGTRLRTPSAVAEAVVRAIEQNKAEINVASASLKLGALISTLWPERFLQIGRRVERGDLLGRMGEAHRHNR